MHSATGSAAIRRTIARRIDSALVILKTAIFAVRKTCTIADFKCIADRVHKSFGTEYAPQDDNAFSDAEGLHNPYNFTFRKRSAFVITDTELKLIAAAARIGLNRIPKNRYSTPATIDTPITL